MLLFPKLQCLFCSIITICTLNTIIALFLHNCCGDHAQFFCTCYNVSCRLPNCNLCSILFSIIIQLFFWIQIKANCYYVLLYYYYYYYYYYFNNLQRLGLSIKQFLVLLKNLWIVDWRFVPLS